MGARFVLCALTVVLVVSGLGWGKAFAAVPAMAAGSDETFNADEENLRYFTDLPVVTHDGEEARFYSDLLKNKRVVISFFYVNCPTAQPTLVTMFKLQKKLGDRLGSDVVLLSISVDPQRDDLEAVRSYAGKFNPRKGWYFITGKPENVDIINKRLGNTMRLPEGHLRQFILGNTRTNHWMRLVESVPMMALEDGLKSLDQKE
jgi:protein SCO1